jgi:hypothetical protein
MRKKWLLSVTVAVGLLAVPSIGFGAPAKEKISPNQITLESGGIGSPLWHKPTDGIISGAAGCVPDIHVFSKGKVPTVTGEPDHIVFTAGVKEIATLTDAKKYKADQEGSLFTIYVEITSNGQKLIELPLHYHKGPGGINEDPVTHKPFWVNALFPGAIDLPTGDYNYSFKAKANDENGNGHVLGTWVPKNHKFTIVD